MVEQISRTIALVGNNDNRVSVALILNAIGDTYGHPDDQPYRGRDTADHASQSGVMRTSQPSKTVGGMLLDAASRWLTSRFGGTS